MSKDRKCESYISVACRGPRESKLLEDIGKGIPVSRVDPNGLRQRVYTALKYAKADVDFLHQYWGEPAALDADKKNLIQLQDPKKADVLTAIRDSAKWLASHRKNSKDWDGGSMTFAFAGHGRPLGSLVLSDRELETAAMIDAFEMAARMSTDGNGTMRLNIVLDSCYSGAFLCRLVLSALDRKSKLLVYNGMAATMTDEPAWEDNDLGHGVFTYCFSVRPNSLRSLGALAIQPDNTWGPALAVTEGPYGCSVVTTGAQNPIKFTGDGRGEFEICGVPLSPYKDPSLDRVYTYGELETELRKLRDDFRKELAVLRRRYRIDFPPYP